MPCHDIVEGDRIIADTHTSLSHLAHYFERAVYTATTYPMGLWHTGAFVQGYKPQEKNCSQEMRLILYLNETLNSFPFSFCITKKADQKKPSKFLSSKLE